MRLGVVMMGTGAYAAANSGVLQALEERGMTPYVVCGMHFGAWTAAQYLCGFGREEMNSALKSASRRAKGMLCVCNTAGAVLTGRKKWLSDGRGVNRLLRLQVEEKLLGLCERHGMFLCRIAASGRRVVFSTQAYAQGSEASFSGQATIGFAARAVMATPPFLSPMPWLGSALLPEESPAFAAEQLLRFGADRVLIVEPRASMAHEPDALELAVSYRRWATEECLPEGTAILRVMMPDSFGALSFEQMPLAAKTGYECAEKELEDVLRRLGMTMCRVIPFRARVQEIKTPI